MLPFWAFLFIKIPYLYTTAPPSNERRTACAAKGIHYIGMGNINNIWFLKDGGQDWANTRCELDNCYSIPYDASADNHYYFQVDIPGDYVVQEAWLCSPDGARLQELLAISEWKIIVGADPAINRLIFRMSPESYACIGQPCIKCLANMQEPGNTPWVTWYQLGTNDITVTVINTTTAQQWVVTDINATLPPGWERVTLTRFYVPCDIDHTEWNIQFTTSNIVGNHTQSWPEFLTEVEVPGCGDPLSCWHIEVPLLGLESGTEEATLQTEPHHCPDCVPTVKLYSDYCLSPYDIDGELIFNTDGIGDTHYGDLTTARNDMRIPAVLKAMPSEIEASRNVRCNTYRQKKTKRYKLQGTHSNIPIDFPDYMVNVIESIFSGKKIYIDGEQYYSPAGAIFTERNVNGYSMKRLDVELTKCPKQVVFDCSCTPEPINCEIDPITYDGIVFVTPAPVQGYGVDRSIWRFSIDTGLLGGGTPPYTISNWAANIGVGTIAPDSSIVPFNDNSDSNFYRRATAYGECFNCLNVTVKITDANGCTKILGNGVDVDDLRCVEQDGHFDLIGQTDTTITIGNVLPATGQPYSYSTDGITYSTSGQVTGGANFTIIGLTPATDYDIYIRVECGGGQVGFIGPLVVTTDP